MRSLISNHSVAASENGWTNDSLCKSWFEDVFVPAAAKHNTSGKPILLIFDGHGSHLTPEMIDHAFTNNVILFLLPAKTSHMLQPLDVGIFNHVQRLWEDRTRERAVTLDPITKADVIREYFDIRQHAFIPRYIADAWRRSGIHPFNRDIFPEEAYAPAQNYSTLVHVPASMRLIPTVGTSPVSARFTSDIEGSTDEDDASQSTSSASDSSDSDTDDMEITFHSSPPPRTPSPPLHRIRTPTSSSRRMFERQGSAPATPSRIRTEDAVLVRASSLPPSSPPPPSSPILAPIAPRPLPVYSIPPLPDYTRDKYRKASKSLSRHVSRRPMALPLSASRSTTSLGSSDGSSRVTRSRLALAASTSDQPAATLEERVEILERRVWFAEENIVQLQGVNQAAEAHISLAIIENSHLRKVNEKTEAKRAKKAKGGPSTIVSLKSGILTAPGKYAEWQAEQAASAAAEALAKEQAAVKAHEQQQAKDERRAIVRNRDYEFVRTWGYYKNTAKVQEVRTLADDLGISLEDGKGKAKARAGLVQEMSDLFAAKPELKTDKRYKALWARRSTAADAADDGQSAAQPPQPVAEANLPSSLVVRQPRTRARVDPYPTAPSGSSQPLRQLPVDSPNTPRTPFALGHHAQPLAQALSAQTPLWHPDMASTFTPPAAMWLPQNYVQHNPGPAVQSDSAPVAGPGPSSLASRQEIYTAGPRAQPAFALPAPTAGQFWRQEYDAQGPSYTLRPPGPESWPRSAQQDRADA